MKGLCRFLRHQGAAGAAEFALILPVALLFLLGLIDVGRYTWAFNQQEKATQVGARWAAVTDTIPGVLRTYSFAVDAGITQGTVVPIGAFPGMVCTSSNGVVSCTCKGGSSAPNFCNAIAPDQAAFDRLAQHMFDTYPGIAADNIRVDYDWSGLGFSGDPVGPDVQPLITVSIVNKRFPLWFMLGRTVPIPTTHYTITAEDGQGTFSY